MKFSKSIFKIMLLGVAVVSLVGCESFKNFLKHQTKPASKGAPYEIITVCNQQQWSDAVGDTLRSILLQPVEMLNQREPIFDVLRVTPDGFLQLNKVHRNVLIINVGKEFKTAVTVQKDVYATNQLIVVASAPSDSAMVSLLDSNREDIVNAFEITERQRHLDTYKAFGSKDLAKLVQQKFGFDMLFPAGFILANQTDNFIWTRYEMPQSGQGILVYQYPYTSPRQLSEDSLIQARNRFAALVPGPSDGSYMTTAAAVSEQLRIDGRLWVCLRGFWDVKGDYMGGPFVSYTTIDAQTGMVVTIDGYVFSPKIHKRNYLRELEHTVYSVKFPDAVK